jgi:EmrB/QacA subfamily drug resistance transporter
VSGGVDSGVDSGVTAEPAVRHDRLALWVISVAQLVLLLDATVVNVALPAIQRALGFSDTGLTWVVTAYSVAFGGLLLLGGRAGDLLGRRRVFMAGLVLFTIASLLGGLAQDEWQLLVCRALQGIGAAGASPAALSLIAATFAEGPPRARALGAYTAIASIGSPLGLVAGGAITTWLSWRWVLLVNVPIGIALVLLAPRALPEPATRAGRFDLTGAVTGTLGVTLLVYGVLRAATDSSGVSHWTDPAVVGTLVGAVVLLAGFVAVERRAAQPLVPLRIFADRQRSGTYLVLVLSSTAMFGVYFFMTLFLQRVWGYSAATTALVYIPMSLVLMGTARGSAKLVGPLGARNLTLGGLVLAAGGLVWLSAIDADDGYLLGLFLPTLLVYAGFGLTQVPLTLTALAGVAPGETGLASGVFSAARQVGGAVGLAALGTVAWAGATGLSADTGGALATGAGRGFLGAAIITAVAAAVTAVTVHARARAREPSGG